MSNIIINLSCTPNRNKNIKQADKKVRLSWSHSWIARKCSPAQSCCCSLALWWPLAPYSRIWCGCLRAGSRLGLPCSSSSCCNSTGTSYWAGRHRAFSLSVAVEPCCPLYFSCSLFVCSFINSNVLKVCCRLPCCPSLCGNGGSRLRKILPVPVDRTGMLRCVIFRVSLRNFRMKCNSLLKMRVKAAPDWTCKLSSCLYSCSHSHSWFQ